MLTGVKLRCYLTPEQAASLRRWTGHQRFIYNAKVQEQDYWYGFSKASLSVTGLKPLPDQAYSQFHDAELTPWLSQVPSQILRNGAYRFAQANARFMKGLGGAPNIKKKYGRQSVMVTSELFEFRERVHPRSKNDGPAHFDLSLGTKKHPLGKLKVKAHVYCTEPKSLTISLDPNGRWYVSFCCVLPAMEYKEPSAEAPIIHSQEELLYEFALRGDLDAITVGLDWLRAMMSLRFRSGMQGTHLQEGTLHQTFPVPDGQTVQRIHQLPKEPTKNSQAQGLWSGCA